MRAKYIILGKCKPVLFQSSLTHKFVAGRMTAGDDAESSVVTGAGFFKAFVTPDGEIDVAVYDGSTSLDMDAKPEDAAIIRAFMGFKC